MPVPYSGNDTFPASYNTPSDGDDADAASVNVGLEALGDRTAWLGNRAISVANGTIATYSDGTGGVQWSHNLIAWTDMQSIDIFGAANDLIEIEWYINYTLVGHNAGEYSYIKLACISDVGGVAARTDLAGAYMVAGSTAATNMTGVPAQATLVGVYAVTAPALPAVGTTRIVMVASCAAAAGSIDVVDAQFCKIKRWRP